MANRHFTKPKEELLRDEENRKAREKDFELQKKQKAQKSRIMLFGGLALVAIITASLAYSIAVNQSKPGQWDIFAKCLAEKGAVMYGWLDGCKYTQNQAAMFGNSFKYLNYKDFQTNPDVRKTPTWYINGEKLEGEQTFETLSLKTGCPLN